MFIKLFILSIIIVAIVLLALGIKLLFDPNAEFTSHSCKLDDEHPNSLSGCSKCQIEDLADCSENKESQV